MKRIITFGTYDLFHIGHLRILERAKQEGDYLIVGVSSDKLNEIKGKKAIFPINERLEIVRSLKCVDEVFIEESLELKDEYIKKFSTVSVDYYGCAIYLEPILKKILNY